jgi:hypothetical protein
MSRLRGMVGCIRKGVNGGTMPEAYADSYEVVIHIHLEGRAMGRRRRA